MSESRISSQPWFDPDSSAVTNLHIQPPFQVVVGWKLVGQPVEGATDLPPVLLVQLQTKETQSQSQRTPLRFLITHLTFNRM